MIEAVIASFQRVDGIAGCPLIIVCDGFLALQLWKSMERGCGAIHSLLGCHQNHAPNIPNLIVNIPVQPPACDHGYIWDGLPSPRFQNGEENYLESWEGCASTVQLRAGILMGSSHIIS